MQYGDSITQIINAAIVAKFTPLDHAYMEWFCSEYDDIVPANPDGSIRYDVIQYKAFVAGYTLGLKGGV